MESNNRWPDPHAAPPGLSLPVAVGRIDLPVGIARPEPKRKRPWGWFLVWTLLVFAGGIAAGPSLTRQAFRLGERASALLGVPAPQFVQRLAPATPTIVPLPAPGVATPSSLASPPTVVPRPPTGEARGLSPTISALPAEPPVAHAEEGASRPQHAKDVLRTASAKGTSVRKGAKNDDPFASAAERANTPAPASPSHKTNGDESAAMARSDPAPKPASTRSHDSLDSLMAEVTTDNAGKNKKHENKDIDAMLKDVQKSNPPPPPKRENPAPQPSLSPGDVSRVMAGVKARGNECAQRLGQRGVVELKLTVGKDGRITNVIVGGKLADTPVAACVEKAARAATFPPSSGLKFDYRIDVR